MRRILFGILIAASASALAVIGGGVLQHTHTSASSGGRLLAPTTQTFLASGTYTRPASILYAIVDVQAGGGGSGGCTGTSASNFVASDGGGGGGFARAQLTAAQIGATQTVTIAAGGTAGASGGAACANNATSGAAGGNVSFGALVVATGGTGGQFGTCSGANPNGINNGTTRAGGTGTTGDLLIPGGKGSTGFMNAPGTFNDAHAGIGGGSYMSAGSNVEPTPNLSSGIAGNNYGVGASGCVGFGGVGGQNGAAGGAPIVIVREFYQ